MCKRLGSVKIAYKERDKYFSKYFLFIFRSVLLMKPIIVLKTNFIVLLLFFHILHKY